MLKQKKPDHFVFWEWVVQICQVVTIMDRKGHYIEGLFTEQKVIFKRTKPKSQRKW